jgi:hypothetical protein
MQQRRFPFKGPTRDRRSLTGCLLIRAARDTLCEDRITASGYASAAGIPAEQSPTYGCINGSAQSVARTECFPGGTVRGCACAEVIFDEVENPGLRGAPAGVLEKCLVNRFLD